MYTIRVLCASKFLTDFTKNVFNVDAPFLKKAKSIQKQLLVVG